MSRTPTSVRQLPRADAPRFGPNIIVDPWNIAAALRADYEEQVRTILAVDLLNGSRTGRVVIEAIWRIQGRFMRIQPWMARETNAEAVPLHEPDSFAPGAELLQFPRGTHRAGPRQFGSGVGTSTVVRFTPQMFAMGAGGLRRISFGDDQRAVLLHEMAHGLRQMRGRERGRAMPGGLENEEEFFAILVANIFASEKGLALRRDHASGVLTNAAAWLVGVHLSRIQNMRRDLPDVCASLAAIGTPFNPFRDAAA